MAVFVLVGGVLLFALGALATVAAVRVTLTHERGQTILATTGGLLAMAVVLLWMDGRVRRYFSVTFWVVVAFAPVVGAAAGRTRRSAALTAVTWVGLFAVVFAARLPLGVPVGGAAVIGFAIEAFTVAFVGLPAVFIGGALAPLTRKHL